MTSRRQIENYKGYWIHSERDGVYLTATADENWCNKCTQYKWIINIVLRNEKMKTNIIKTTCIDCLEKNNSDDSILVKPQFCPFSNHTRTESVNICKDCCNVLIDSTSKLYETIEMPPCGKN